MNLPGACSGETVVWISPEQHKVVGEILMTVRKEAGIMQDDLALRLQKAQSFISAYENGQRRVDVLELLRICGAIGADPEEVFRRIRDAANR